ncbi:hypothetical protein BO71DRAFT_480620 [Aspergillus ellipticus CBS 707.79]|uniref:Uncharacterized protein n=1 Tax=Aspergillus ellipticus CBS 707.79 TaxID=1448320 RepID=A0A319DKI7_9EURO|nr:hypothetical protein BO71DRAFT_480620 [Aspergillus ellipticus CBS 707.79]
MPEIRYHDISQGAYLLGDIKDIQDLLNMLRSLAEAQAHVWQHTFETTDLDSFTSFQFTDSCTPNMVLRDIQDMLAQSEKVQDSIETLSDLRRKQASIKEAEPGRQQASDRIKHANIVLVFTFVTTFFLPLSFLTSLFALNVSDFPHEPGNFQYQGWWIFPVLFGVSACVSIPLMVVAFNIETVIRVCHQIKSKLQLESTTATNASSPETENILSRSDEKAARPKELFELKNFALQRRRRSLDLC